MTLDEIRSIVRASIVATALPASLPEDLPPAVAEGARTRIIAILANAQGIATTLANKASDIDFNGILARLLVQHAGVAASVIFQVANDLGDLCTKVVEHHGRIAALEAALASARAEIAMLRRDLTGKEGLDA